MRLGDLDALVDFVNMLDFEGGTKTRCQAGNEVLHIHMPHIINQAPTIDPEDLRPKGRWVRVEDSECYWYECSECGEEPLKRYKYDCFSSYCPHCGAKMLEFDN